MPHCNEVNRTVTRLRRELCDTSQMTVTVWHEEQSRWWTYALGPLVKERIAWTNSTQSCLIHWSGWSDWLTLIGDYRYSLPLSAVQDLLPAEPVCIVCWYKSPRKGQISPKCIVGKGFSFTCSNLFFFFSNLCVLPSTYLKKWQSHGSCFKKSEPHAVCVSVFGRQHNEGVLAEEMVEKRDTRIKSRWQSTMSGGGCRDWSRNATERRRGGVRRWEEGENGGWQRGGENGARVRNEHLF